MSEEKCVWSWDEGTHSSTCGKSFEFFDGSATENGFKFCPYCGKPIDDSNKEEADRGNE